MGLAAELGRQLCTPATGLVTDLILMAVPQLSWYAQNTRAYRLAFATLLLYRAAAPVVDQLIGYAVAVLLLGLAHILGLLVLAGHLYALVTRWWRGRDRRLGDHVAHVEVVRQDAGLALLPRWAPVTAVALLPVLPLALLGLGPRGDQFDCLPPMTLRTVRAAPGGLFGSGTVALLVAVVRRPRRHLIIELVVTIVIPPASCSASPS